MSADNLISALEQSGVEVVIGVETHVRLNTLSKLFCSCDTSETDEPNINICPVCTGQMGVLPSVNREAVRKAILLGKALGADIPDTISWDRKHYEYPDLPKNYQLTQFHKPVIRGGKVNCFREDGTLFSVEIEQAHIEEDAAKLIHEKSFTLVDFNKSGVPLVEIVTKPCIFNIKDASIYAHYLHRMVQSIGISGANLEKGEFKSDVSVSLRLKGAKELNPRTEIKNLNSFRFMSDAIEEEVSKQYAYYVKHKEFRSSQTTVLWDADLKQTRTMRKKEFAADYRFLPEPDIPSVNIRIAVDSIFLDSSLLPFSIEKRLIEGGIRPQDAGFFTSDSTRASIFTKLCSSLDDILFVAKTLTNSVKAVDYEKIKSVDNLADIMSLLKSGVISYDLFKHTVKHLLDEPLFDYRSFIESNTISRDRIASEITSVLKEHPSLNGAGAITSRVMSRLGKLAPGKVVREMVEEWISGRGSESVESALSLPEAAESIAPPMTGSEFKLPYISAEYRSHRVCDVDETLLGANVTFAGWVASLRDHGDLLFIDLRDTSNEIFQLRVEKLSFPDIDMVSRLKPESVIMAGGSVVQREEGDFNNSLRSGKLELEVERLEVLNYSQVLPFEVRRALHINEASRFRYKFLDHRNNDVHKAIVNRHKVIKLIRDTLDRENFIEIETPVLTGGTDEGAREFIVPSRKFPGKFYTLPQAPQQFKQMLMVGGFERYFQIARCFRDEDSRGDRQPEFTQLDMELSFASMKQIMDLNTMLFETIVHTLYKGKWKLFPFRIITYAQAMERYGTDRPDLRYGLEMQNITDVVKSTAFRVFADPIERGGVVKCIKVSGKVSGRALSKGQIEQLTAKAVENGLGGLAYIVVNENELQSPIIKYLGEDIAGAIISATDALPGDIVFFSAAEEKVANKALDVVRQEIAKMLHLIKPNELHPAWVVDFPLFERRDDGGWTFSHNPFSMPKVEHIQDHIEGRNIGSIISQQYDLVVNGNEVGGGSVRAHVSEILEATYRNMGYNKEEMMRSVGHMWEAFRYGAPPHGGIAWGVDRLMMILEKRSSIREVMAFPKTGAGEDLLFSCPSTISPTKISEANIFIIKPEGD